VSARERERAIEIEIENAILLDQIIEFIPFFPFSQSHGLSYCVCSRWAHLSKNRPLLVHFFSTIQRELAASTKTLEASYSHRLSLCPLSLCLFVSLLRTSTNHLCLSCHIVSQSVVSLFRFVQLSPDTSSLSPSIHVRSCFCLCVTTLPEVIFSTHFRARSRQLSLRLRGDP